jgi:hypothetical protein
VISNQVERRSKWLRKLSPVTVPVQPVELVRRTVSARPPHSPLPSRVSTSIEVRLSML